MKQQGNIFLAFAWLHRAGGITVNICLNPSSSSKNKVEKTSICGPCCRCDGSLKGPSIFAYHTYMLLKLNQYKYNYKNRRNHNATHICICLYCPYHPFGCGLYFSGKKSLYVVHILKWQICLLSVSFSLSFSFWLWIYYWIPSLSNIIDKKKLLKTS